MKVFTMREKQLFWIGVALLCIWLGAWAYQLAFSVPADPQPTGIVELQGDAEIIPALVLER